MVYRYTKIFTVKKSSTRNFTPNKPSVTIIIMYKLLNRKFTSTKETLTYRTIKFSPSFKVKNLTSFVSFYCFRCKRALATSPLASERCGSSGGRRDRLGGPTRRQFSLVPAPSFSTPLANGGRSQGTTSASPALSVHVATLAQSESGRVDTRSGSRRGRDSLESSSPRSCGSRGTGVEKRNGRGSQRSTHVDAQPRTLNQQQQQWGPEFQWQRSKFTPKSLQQIARSRAEGRS